MTALESAESDGQLPASEQTVDAYTRYSGMIQRAAEYADSLPIISDDAQVLEVEALGIAMAASQCLIRAADCQAPLVREWHAEAAEINPIDNLVGFLAWDGITIPAAMKSISDTHNSVVMHSRRLSTALFKFTIDTYIKHHGDTVTVEQEQDQTQALTQKVIQALAADQEIPLDGIYKELLLTAMDKRPYDYNSITHPITYWMDYLQKERRAFTAEHDLEQREAISTQASQIHTRLHDIWAGLLTGPSEPDDDWQQVQDRLLGKQPREPVDATVVNDAVQLLATIGRAYKGDDKSLRRLVTGIRILRESEATILLEAKQTISDARQFERLGVEVTMLQDAHPRLNEALQYLYRNTSVVQDALTVVSTFPFDNYTLGQFLWEVTVDPQAPPDYRSYAA